MAEANVAERKRAQEERGVKRKRGGGRRCTVAVGILGGESNDWVACLCAI